MAKVFLITLNEENSNWNCLLSIVPPICVLFTWAIQGWSEACCCVCPLILLLQFVFWIHMLVGCFCKASFATSLFVVATQSTIWYLLHLPLFILPLCYPVTLHLCLIIFSQHLSLVWSSSCSCSIPPSFTTFSVFHLWSSVGIWLHCMNIITSVTTCSVCLSGLTISKMFPVGKSFCDTQNSETLRMRIIYSPSYVNGLFFR